MNAIYLNFYLWFYPFFSNAKVLPKVLHSQSNLDIVMMIAKYIWLFCRWLKTMSFRVNCVDCIHMYTCNFLMQPFYVWKDQIVKIFTFSNTKVIKILIYVLEDRFLNHSISNFGMMYKFSCYRNITYKITFVVRKMCRVNVLVSH